MKADSIQSPFLRGAVSAVGIVIGYFPIAVTFGLLASEEFSSIQALGFSLFVFAGASQFMAVKLIAGGARAVEVVFVTFLMNFRHFLMSTALSHRLKLNRRPLALLIGFGVTDETFAVAATGTNELSPWFMLGLEMTAYTSWVSGTLLGYLVGSFIPGVLQKSMGVLLYALFTALLVGQLKKSLSVALIAGFAAVLSTALNVVFPAGWSLIIAIIATSLFGAAITGKDETKE